MKSINLIRFYIVTVVFAGLFLNSCQKDPVTADYNFFISNEFKFQVTAQETKIKLLIAQSMIPDISEFGDWVKTDIDVHKINYKTTLQSKNIQASGLVYLPKTAGNYPVLCFQNGTNTLHSEAPSANPKSDMLFMLESLASMGFIVVVPDYIGFGVSSNLPHPYLHAESTTQSILDMLRAVNEFSTDEKIVAKPTKDLYIFGYSQGGWATMQLQRAIEKNYSSEFNLIASSCAAGPYSLDYMNEYITGQTDYQMPYFLAYLLNSYHSLGLVSNIGDFIQEDYAKIIPDLFDGKHSGGTINSELTTRMADLLTPEYRTQFATNNPNFIGLKSAFITNSVAPWKISTQTRLYHGSEDDLIPQNMSLKMLQDLKTADTEGSKIELIIIQGANHSDGVIPVAVETIKWFMKLKK